MTRIPLMNKSNLPKTYDILEKKEHKLPDDVDASFWNRQPTVRAFSNNTELGEAHITMNTFLWTETGFTEAEEEFIILTVTNELESRLLWHDHVMLAINNDRLSKSEILGISNKSTNNIDDNLQKISDYVLEFVNNNGKVSDEVYQMISSEYENDFIISLGKLAGFYIALSHEVNALELDRDPFVGWQLENYDDAEPP